MRVLRRWVLAAVAVALAASAVVGGGGLGVAGIESVGAQVDPLAPAIKAGPTGRTVLPGPWILRGDRSAHGEAKGYHTGAFEGRMVSVPHAANGRVITGVEGLKSFRGTVAWYRTEITVPRDGGYVLRFESVHHKATVWLDGRRIGHHTGVYLPFELRVALQEGRSHTLVVRADYRGPTDQKRSGWHRTWFNFGGLNREVTIRPATPSEITRPPSTRLGSTGAVVDITAHIRNVTDQARELRVRGTLSREGKRHELRFPALLVDPGQTRVVHAQVNIADAAFWEPGSPNLYDLDLEVPGESGYHVKTGLREISWIGSRVFLNGRRLRLHGASIHEDVRNRGDALTVEDMDRIVASLQQIGANATRMQHQLNPALLERLDAAGIVVWQGIGPVDAPGAWTNRTKGQQASARARARKSFFQTQPHPSVIAWNLANEVAGNGHPTGQAAFIDFMARELKRRDPGKLIAVDVWARTRPSAAGSGSSTATSTPSRSPTTSAGTRSRWPRAARSAAGSAAAPASSSTRSPGRSSSSASSVPKPTR